jgi:hypothetical protein
LTHTTNLYVFAPVMDDEWLTFGCWLRERCMVMSTWAFVLLMDPKKKIPFDFVHTNVTRVYGEMAHAQGRSTIFKC